MATPPEAVRTQLAVVTTAAATDLATTAAQATPERSVSTLLNALPLIVPSYYDAAGALAVAWYDERRDESRPTTVYAPNVIGDPATDWIEREVAKFQQTIEADMEGELQRILDEATRLAEKEVARGFRDSVTGNVRMDEEATANFAAHTDCHCAARPEFRNGEHGPEASVEQYLASTKNRTAKQRKRLREYLNENYPDAPG
jgi:hypothetical protein